MLVQFLAGGGGGGGGVGGGVQRKGERPLAHGFQASYQFISKDDMERETLAEQQQLSNATLQIHHPPGLSANFGN